MGRAMRLPRARLLACAAIAATLAAGPAAREGSAGMTDELQKKINAAVEKGVVWLSKQRHADGSFGTLRVANVDARHVGMASLAGYALVMSGVPKADLELQKTLAYVRSTDVLAGNGGTRATYDSGLLILFVTEMYRPDAKEKDKDHRYAKPKEKGPCGHPTDVRDWLSDVAHWLVSVQMEDGWWRYPTSPPADLSNTQYALLGLRAARDCGIPVPATTFLKALEATRSAQEADGPKMRRVLPPTKPGERSYSFEAGDKARGLCYQAGSKQLLTGSMTTAGLGTLAICHDALVKPSRFEGYVVETEKKAGRAVADGFAWLEKNWSVDKNPPAGAPAWHLYYLYGLQRACPFP